MEEEVDMGVMSCSECKRLYDTRELEIEVVDLMLKTYCSGCMKKIDKARKVERDARIRQEKVLRERRSMQGVRKAKTDL
jgi:hypothetical protein